VTQQPDIRQIVLERMKLYLRREVDLESIAGVRDSAKFYAHLDEYTRRLVLEMRAYVLAGEKVTEETSTTLTWPADWWQAFRARWFPRWWLRRWPVRHEVRVVTTKTTIVRTCPHLSIPARPHSGAQVHLTWLVPGQMEGKPS